MYKPLNNPQRDPDKDTHFQTQMKRVFAAFKERPKTMLMVSVETGIMRSNITWFVREWKQSSRIAKVKTGICAISKHRAGYYTTDENLFTQPPKLF